MSGDLTQAHGQTLRIEPGAKGAAARVVVQCMNSAPEGPPLSGTRVLLAPAGAAPAAKALAAAMTRATLAGIMHARDPESRATAAAVQAAQSTVIPKKARALTAYYASPRHLTRASQEIASLGNLGAMPWTQEGGEPLGSVSARADAAWASAVAAVAEERAGGGSGCVLLIADPVTIAAVIVRALVRALAIDASIARHLTLRCVRAVTAAVAVDAGPLPAGCVRADGADAQRSPWRRRRCQCHQRRFAPAQPAARAAIARAVAAPVGGAGLGPGKGRQLVKPGGDVCRSRSEPLLLIPWPAAGGGGAGPDAWRLAPARHLACSACSRRRCSVAGSLKQLAER